jgi:ATP-dependent exoDNAse (exonuclease V) beta subunit
MTASDTIDLDAELAVLERSDIEPQATLGTLIHQALEALTRTPGVLNSEPSRHHLELYWRQQLQPWIDDEDTLTRTVVDIGITLESCVNNSELAWIFDPGLEDSGTEVQVSRRLGERVYHYVVDRTFIDRQGVRWIIDYKTAARKDGEAEDDFVNEQCRQHLPQLDNYRSLYRQLEERPIRIALLLTGIPRLVELN